MINQSVVRHARVILTDAQVKALPTTPQTIIPSRGVGLAPLVLAATMRLDWVANYTNIAADCTMQIVPSASAAGATGPLSYLYEGSTDAKISLLLAVGGSSSCFLLCTQVLKTIPPLVDFTFGNFADVGANQDWILSVDNVASGNFTGGNVSNRLRVDVLFVDVNTN